MNRSESIKELSIALAKFNGEISSIAKDAKNPFFKSDYVTLDALIKETRPLLQKHGLSVLQFPSGDGNLISLTTMLLHESGEYIESAPISMKPVKNDPQAAGSLITYIRRYSYQAILSLNTGEDDDGNQATHSNNTQQRQPQNKVINKQQYAELKTLILELSSLVSKPFEECLNTLGIKSLESLPQAKYDEIKGIVLQSINKYKK